ncbi:hypothetical protein CTEN210_13225 [Chaetoceros tenuissimus]|uniref:RING-type domain-containing protein n=1 Tax=Chaetoceros tenuissimus TaxID=426638 RepID=A0AAD3HB82_9STRA|nr:hypothetical protein CTEN210_13225 [Chaetoceros tenuissimus]
MKINKTRIQILSFGHDHNICIVIDGSYVQCVGKNNNYQLGTGVAEPSIAKQFLRSKIWDQYQVEKIICGKEYTCILSEGRVLCIGLIRNKMGEEEIYPKPYSIPNLRNVIDIYSSQNYACAIDTSYAVWCWGSNMHLDSNTTNKEGITSGVPQIVESLSGNSHDSQAPKLALADNYLCASVDKTKIKCVGQWAKDIDIPSSVKEIVAGSDHVCTLLHNGNVLCWGTNKNGAVGANSVEQPFIEQPMLVLEDAKQIDATDNSTFALTKSGQAYAWGQNDFFQLGLCKEDIDTFEPSKVSILSDDTRIDSIHLTARTGHAILEDGGILSWGTNTYGTLGDGDSDPALQSTCYPHQMKVLNSSGSFQFTGELLLVLVLILFAITFILRYFIKGRASNELNADSAHNVQLEREKRHEIIYQNIVHKKFEHCDLIQSTEHNKASNKVSMSIHEITECSFHSSDSGAFVEIELNSPTVGEQHQDSKRRRKRFLERSKSIRSSLNISTHKENDEEAPRMQYPKLCSICVEEYREGDDIAWSKNEICSHVYHTDCIVAWLMNHSDCPLCRNDFLDANLIEI